MPRFEASSPRTVRSTSTCTACRATGSANAPSPSNREDVLSAFFATVDWTASRWVFDAWILSAYLDVQGVTYHGNVEAVQYNYDSTEKGYVENLPILPSIGIKGEF